ncbi:MAG: hypothetical protein HYY91_04330 [Candidatus Omnitrophica bacterium]|nr:hypothetical protein [Candidatus Omnitrophota bacterium]
MKATLISAVLLGLLAISVPSFAEVQNVKVSGDITVRAFHREYLDLAEDNNEATADTIDSHDEFLMTTTGINIGADLTENVSAFIRLANERDWNVDGGATGDFDVSQAYITLRELFYSPLTVKIGTQPIVWGRGFVLGSNLIPSILNAATDRNTAITANEYTDFTAFDAIRATLDLSNVGGLNLPLTADYVYIKSNEGVTGVADDVTIQGVNFSTRFDQMDSEMEAYYLNKRDKSRGAAVIAGDINEDGSVNTWGLRGSLKPVEGAYAYGEIAIQHGRSATDPTGLVTAGSGVKAWAFDLGADYTFANVAMTPKLGAEWIFWSGQDYDGAVSGWDPIARGYFTSAIREFHIGQTAAGFYITDQPGDTSAATNQHQLGFYGSLKPLLYAVFWPGTVYDSVADDNHTAQQLVSTISLKF